MCGTEEVRTQYTLVQATEFAINFMSQHYLSQKRGTTLDIVDETSLSHPKFHQKINLVMETLLNNDYPLNFIFDTINNRLRSLLNKRTGRQNNLKITEKQ